MRSRISLSVGILIALSLAAVALAPPQNATMGAYCTSFEGRSEHQRLNAERAARALDGVTIPGGGELSFNRTVGPWTADRGYLKAPVSFGGEMHPAWGGGVCQTSTTLYNAALLAGLEIVERHRHQWAPDYVPPGRDAAVAQYDIDLRLRNPHPWPVRIETEAAGDSLEVRLVGRREGPLASVHTQVRAVLAPREVTQIDSALQPGECHRPGRGQPGYRVLVFRVLADAPDRRELVSEDRYPPMNRLVIAGP